MTNGGDMPQRLLARSSCFEQVAAHELGHALGVGHAADGTAPMGSFLQCEGTFGTLVSTTAAPGDQVRAGTISSGTLTLAWDAPTTGDRPTGYVIEAGTRSGAADVANISTGTTATTFSAAVSFSGAYYIRVRATTAGGVSGPSNEVIFALDALPNAPVGLSASVSGSTVTLTWSPPAAAAVTAYIVEAGSAPGAADLANFSTNNPATSFTAFGVGPGTYFARVRAANLAAVSPPSNEVPVVVGSTCAAAPGAPGSLATAVSGSTVTLTWTPGARATSYLLAVGSRPGGSDILQTDLGSAATSLTAVNVGANTYFVRVRSRNACGVSASSNEAVVIVR
jgi:hypothetical protein